LIDTINGTTQHAIEAPIPANGAQQAPERDAYLAAVSCSDAQTCVAVGFYYTPSGKRYGLLDTEAAGSWTATEAPLNGAANVDLTDVACNPDGCAAVGTVGSGHGVILARDGSGTWTRQQLTTPTGLNDATDMSDVDCPASGPCYALGQAGTGAATRTLLFAPQGSGWSGTDLATPDGADPAHLAPSRLGCSTAGNCALLVLWTSADGRHSGLAADVLAGGALSAAPVNLPSGVTAYYPPAGMDCPSPTACFGVDPAAHVGGGVIQPLIVQGSASTWNAILAPSPPNHPDAPTFLQDIACSSPTDCTATGGLATKRSVVDTLSNGSWQSAALPPPGNLGRYYSADYVDCAGGRCAITGDYLVDTPRYGYSDSAFVSVSGSS
jgi:hypothetical protein